MDHQINNFFLEFNKYIDYNNKQEIKEKYFNIYNIYRRKKIKSKKQKIFIKIYKKLGKYVNKWNNQYINDNINLEMFNNICGCKLDLNQRKAVLTDEINTLLIAGAGSGKTLTIIAKINYLVNIKKISCKDILCISFTNFSANSLKNKLKHNIEVLTFHKLALKILNNQYQISSESLDYIVDEYFNSIIYNNEYMIKKVFKILKIKNKDIDFYSILLKDNQLLALKRTIITFINIFKGNNYKEEMFIKIYKKELKDILSLIIDIYFLYQEELKSQNEIDFNDMINLATTKVIKENINLNYKYIIIDEYQDTSFTRYNLIKAIINKCGAKLFAVGDDWQSIYKFTGCDLNIFLNFEKYFGYTKRIFITNTYRNCQELINVAGKFILKNKKQIKKKLLSNKNIYKPIKIIYENSNILEKLIIYLIRNNYSKILILGRNNNDIDKYLTPNLIYKENTIIYKYNKNVNIKYMTIHRSKGLEEECVVILNLIDDIKGFPSKMKNNEVIELICKSNDNQYDEERRLFYVGLTRTKSNIYLIIPHKNISAFVKEIVRKGNKNVEYLFL